MTFISYAQNFEDVILWRAFKNLQNGFYVDVGANDPINDSVTQAFYEKGWRGINIEPMEFYYERLINLRINDINIRTAVGNNPGLIPFYEIPNTGISTVSKEIAQKQMNAGWSIVEKTIPVITLNEILIKYAPPEIHFLKIDVEGSEYEVIEGLDLKFWRPWILIVEAINPLLSQGFVDTWEPIVLAASYELVYFDGLNKFYLAEEHADLREIINTPPNIFDGFITSQHRDSINEKTIIQEQINKYQSERDSLHDQFIQAQAVNSDLQRKLSQINDVVEELKTHNYQSQVDYNKIQSALQQTESDKNSLHTQLKKTQTELDVLKAQLCLAESEIGEISTQLRNVYQSRSFRITAPLRTIFEFVRVQKKKWHM